MSTDHEDGRMGSDERIANMIRRPSPGVARDRLRHIIADDAGNGPDRPLETNDTPEGREKNRRTDIKVYPNPAQ